MSLAAIRAGIYTTLTACGPYSGAEVSSCDFGVLEGAATCAVVFMPSTGTRVEPLRVGGHNTRGYTRIWSISGHVYVKDTGDPTALLDRAWKAHDDIYNTLSKDDSLNSSACASRLTGFSFDENAGVEAGGAVWADVRWSLEAEEF